MHISGTQILRCTQNDRKDVLLQILRCTQNDRKDVLLQILRYAPLDLHKGKKYGWNVYFCCIKETGQPTVK